MTKNNELIIYYNERRIPVHVRYSARKRLSLTIYPGGKVVAKAPPGIPLSCVQAFVRKRAAWMDKHLRRFEEHPPAPPKVFVSGEIHPWLGREYRLLLNKSARASVNIQNQEIRVFLPDPGDKAAVEKRLQDWYRKEALRILTPRFWELSESLYELDLPEHKLRFYRMKRRWGSCSSKGVITLNTELIKKAPELIDYVILHELCHLKVPAHNKAFYTLLESVLPDWKTRRKELNGR
ncbi:MAG: SprT family zinc-dependent metalloprotease [Fidelibacterota bacterium]